MALLGKSLRPSPPGPASGGRALSRALSPLRLILDRPSGWYAPHSWTDTGGLYVDYAAKQAWLYNELPLSALRQGADRTTELDHLLDAISRLAPNRQTHLLMHAWEEQVEIPAGTPAALRDFLQGAFTFFVPTRTLLLGVRLEKSKAAEDREGGVIRSILRHVDRALGEFAPDLDAWDDDRVAVEALLAQAGGTPPSLAAASHLESWYTLGAVADVDAEERDTELLFDHGDIAELCAVASLDTSAGALNPALLSAGRRGATVSSVRGQLSPGSGTRGQGLLDRASIVLGRRADEPGEAWTTSLAEYSGLEQRPLPLRQLAGLDETLPCSKQRLSPMLRGLSVADLATVGFSDTVQVGDDRGYFLGVGGFKYSSPCYLDPSAEGSAVTLVTGAAAFGKTFFAEAVAIQAAIAGQRVLYVSTTPEAGTTLRDMFGAAELPTSAVGALDPYRYLDGPSASTLLSGAISQLVPSLTDADLRDITAGFRRAAATGSADLPGMLQAFALADGTAAVARVQRELRHSPRLTPVLSTAHPVRADLARVTVADLSPLRQTGDSVDLALLDVAAATLIEHVAARPHDAGTLLVLDAADELLHAPHTAAAVAKAAAGGGAHLLIVTSDVRAADADSLARFADRFVCFGESDADAADAAFALVGLPATYPRRAWMYDAGPELDEDVVVRPALAVHRDRQGRITSLLAGPAPIPALASLSRGAQTDYLPEV